LIGKEASPKYHKGMFIPEEKSSIHQEVVRNSLKPVSHPISLLLSTGNAEEPAFRVLDIYWSGLKYYVSFFQMRDIWITHKKIIYKNPAPLPSIWNTAVL
jgi:hypothetical protein